ncbi:hypothetical protein Tco_0884809 [Tanacetum coccineum]
MFKKSRKKRMLQKSKQLKLALNIGSLLFTTMMMTMTRKVLKDIIFELPLSIAITPDFLITNSLIMEDEHLDTIPETESDEVMELGVEDLKLTLELHPHHFNAEYDLIESLLNRDTSIVSSPKFDSLLEEFFGELAHIDLISPEIDEADFDPEEEIRLVEKLLYDNSSPRLRRTLNMK